MQITILSTLKGILKIVEKACIVNIDKPDIIVAHAENAKDMLTELIKELEKEPPKPPQPSADPTMCACENKVVNEGSDICNNCGKKVDLRAQVL